MREKTKTKEKTENHKKNIHIQPKPSRPSLKRGCLYHSPYPRYIPQLFPGPYDVQTLRSCPTPGVQMSLEGRTRICLYLRACSWHRG